jgi:hypothetical protein
VTRLLFAPLSFLSFYVSPHSSSDVFALCAHFLLDGSNSSSSVVAGPFAAPVAVPASAAEALWETSTRGRRGSSLTKNPRAFPEQMGSWFSVSSKAHGQLTITATSTGVPGFPVGKALSFFAGPGETVGTVVERLNKYRGPDSQIAALRYGGGDRMGDPLPFSVVIEGPLQAMI